MKLFREIYAQSVNATELENILELLSKDIVREVPNKSANQITKDLTNILENDLRTNAALRWSGEYFQTFIQKVNNSRLINKKQYQQLIVKFNTSTPKERIDFMVELKNAIESNSKANIFSCVERQLENLPSGGKISLDLEPKTKPKVNPSSAASTPGFITLIDSMIDSGEVEQTTKGLVVQFKGCMAKTGGATMDLTPDGKLTANMNGTSYTMNIKDRDNVVQVLERIAHEQGPTGTKKFYWIVRADMVKQELKAMNALEKAKEAKFQSMISDFPRIEEIFEDNNHNMDLTLKELKVKLLSDRALQAQWKMFVKKYGLGFFAHFNPKNIKSLGVMGTLALATGGYEIVQLYHFLSHVARESRDLAVTGGNIAGASQIKIKSEPTIGQINHQNPTNDLQPGLNPDDSLLFGRSKSYQVQNPSSPNTSTLNQSNVKNLPSATQANLQKMPPNIANWFADHLSKKQ